MYVSTVTDEGFSEFIALNIYMLGSIKEVIYFHFILVLSRWFLTPVRSEK